MSAETLSTSVNKDDELPVQVFGGGANTEHFGAALQGVRTHRPVELFDIRDISPHVVPHDKLYRLDDPEGKEAAERAMGERALAAYLSLIPSMHVEAIKRQLQRVGEGALRYVIVPKPVVQTIAEMKEVDSAIASAISERSELTDSDVSSEFPPLFVHEHYVVKGAWSALSEQLGTVMDYLGRLESATVTIEEKRTVESEGRAAAFAGGALEDLGPHVISIGLDVEAAFNKSNRFSNSNKSHLELERYRYADSTLPHNVETGFIVHGKTTVIDHFASSSETASYELPFKWQGGKGLEDKKYVELAFIHPESGERSMITVDLQRNSLDIPDAVRHLFAHTQFTDNGYGDVVEAGLNGGDPAASFQDWETARKVVKVSEYIRKQDTRPLVVYLREGQSLEDLASVA